MRRREAAVLVAVLLVALALAAVVFASVFLAVTDALAAGNAQRGARAEAAAEGALHLAAAEVARAWASGAPTPVGARGPWPLDGIDGTATLVALDADTVSVVAVAADGPVQARRSAVLGRGAAGIEVLARP